MTPWNTVFAIGRGDRGMRQLWRNRDYSIGGNRSNVTVSHVFTRKC